MKIENYIFQIILNKEAKDKLSDNSLMLKNIFINETFINNWNNFKEDKLINSIEQFKYLFKVSNSYLEIVEKLKMWYFDFKIFNKYSMQDFDNIESIYNEQKENDKNNYEPIINKNNIYECSSIKSTDDLIKIEQKRNYILKQIFNSVYFQLDELISILYYVSSNGEGQNILLKEKLKSLNNIEWFIIDNNDQIIFAEIISIKNYFKIWKDISFPMTKVKLNEFLLFINKIYSIIDNNFSAVSIFTTKVKDVYYKMCELNLIK